MKPACLAASIVGLVVSALTGASLAQDRAPALSPGQNDRPSARPPAPSTEGQSRAAATTSGGQPAGAVPKDPQGVRGLSPFYEAILRGDAAFAAQDYDGADSEYAAAIKSDPKNPVGHLRQAQLALRTEKWEQAREAALSAERFAEDAARRAQALFLVSMVDERRGALDAASKSWEKAAALSAAEATGEASPASIHSETPSERQSVIEARKEQLAQYQSVKQRIEQRLGEAEQSAADNAKK